MSSTLRQRALRWLSATALGAALALPLAAQAAPMQLDFYFDLDNSASSGCSAHAAGQSIQGFERAVRIRYDDAAHTVDAASVAQCSGGSLQAPSALDVSLWRVAPDPGNAAQVVLSGSIPAAVFPAAPSGVVVTSSASGSVLSVLGGNPGFASLRGLHGIAVPSSGPVPVPTLGHWALLALALALALAALAWRRRQAAGQLLGLTGASLLGLLMLGSPGQAQAGNVTITPPAGGTTQPGQVLRAQFTQDGPGAALHFQVTLLKSATQGRETINGIPVPPVPDVEKNNATLAGVDSDQNGVRDDVDRFIAIAIPKDQMKNALNAARFANAALVKMDGEELFRFQCLAAIMAEYESIIFRNIIFNTKERIEVYRKIDTKVGEMGEIYTSSDGFSRSSNECPLGGY